jgi:uncharacterized membrane protein affecting hemolysin expression
VGSGRPWWSAGETPIAGSSLPASFLNFFALRNSAVTNETGETEQQEPVQKQKASVYTMMLICSFIALVLACLLMYMELQRYDFDFEAEKYRSSRTDRTVATSTFLG